MKTLILAAFMAASMVNGCAGAAHPTPATIDCTVDRIEDGGYAVVEVVHDDHEIDMVDIPDWEFLSDPCPGMKIPVYSIECTCDKADSSSYGIVRDDGHMWNIESCYGGIQCYEAWSIPSVGDHFASWWYDNGTAVVEDDVLVWIDNT